MADDLNDSTNTGDMAPDAFRRAAHALADWIADHLSNLDEVPVLPDCGPGDILGRLPDHTPEQGESMETIFNDFEQIILPGMTHWNHPAFFAYFSITGSGPGILGELLSAALNVNAMLWKTCPSATELERCTLNWLRVLVGLPDGFWGIIYDTASVSTMHAIAAARETLNLGIRERGMAGCRDMPVLVMYTSAHAHSSVEKAAITLGIGSNNVRKIDVDGDFRMQPDRLKHAIREDRAAGLLPFCAVATVGTTSTTSIDPVADIAEICRAEKLWLHVDAAYGGPAAILPEMRHVLNGCEQADSLVLNPHKWLFVPIDCSAFYTRRPGILRQAFSLVPEYLKTSEDAEVENLMDYGIQLGRRFRALKLWFVLRYFGREGIIKRIRYHLMLARIMASLIDKHPDFELMAPLMFSTVCFRYHPGGVEDQEVIDRLNQCLLEKVNKTRRVFLSHTRLNGRYVLRMAIGNLHTRKEHVQRAWQILVEKAGNGLIENVSGN
jgi:aromatic-L-amino-acid decarboxylase